MRHFFPRRKRNGRLYSGAENETRTILLYEAPHRLVKTLKELLEELGDRKIAVCRELTKVHETALRTTIARLWPIMRPMSLRGECVLVIQEKAGARFARSSRRRGGS